MKKRNYFANKENSSFLNLVKMITENVDDETEGLDFDDEAEGDDFDTEGDNFDAEGDDLEDDMGEDVDGDMVSIELPRDVAQQLYDVLSMMLGGEEGDDLEGDDEFADEEGDDFDTEEGDDFDVESDDEMADEFEEFGADDAEQDDEDTVEEAEEEDEEVLGSDQSNVAQSTISRDGAPKRSKANTSWNTGKTVKSVFDQTVSHEGEPAGTSRDGAPKRSKFTKGWNNSKTVNSRLQPNKHIAEIGK